jgi:predicted transcriptional regulator
MPNIFHPHRSGAAVAVGPLESEILEILWQKDGLIPVPEVHSALTGGGREISYSAVKAVLNNLTEKGWLRKERQGKVTCFAPLKSRDEFDSMVITSVIGSLKRNYGQPVIAQFVDQLAVDEAAIEEFERLIAQRKAELGK